MISAKTRVQITLALVTMLVLFYFILLLRHQARGRELIIFIEKGNLAGVREILSKGADLNARDEDGNTPLLKAAEFDRASIATLLVQHGADVNARNNAGTTALLYAAQNGGTELAQFLMDSGAAIEARTNSGDTALILASRSGHLEMASLLCLRGADVNAANTVGHTSLMAGSKAGSMATVRLLLSRRAAINARDRDGKTALLVAVEKDALQRPPRGPPPAIAPEHRQVALFLLYSGAEVDARTAGGLTALGAAVQAGTLDIAHHLLLKGADPRLLDAPARSTLLVNTAAGGYTRLLRILLRYTWDLDARDPEGRTALTMAVLADQLGTLKLLLDAGAAINATCAPKNKNAPGGTALIVAAYYGRLDALRMLLNRGAAVNAVDAAGRTALLAALDIYRTYRLNWQSSRSGTFPSATPGKPTRIIVTPAERKRLDLAMQYEQRRYTSIVRLLLSRGADPNVRDKSGDTPLSLARRSQDATLIRLLQQAGAKR